MHKVTFILFFLINIVMLTHAQVNNKYVLRAGVIGKEWKHLDRKDKSTTKLKYLDVVKSANGAKYKILTSIWIWGQAHRATNRILIFDNRNKYLGQYYVTMTYDLPNYIKDNKLIFLNSDNIDDGCDMRLVTEISFSAGLPKQIFIRCKGDEGDLYPFEKGGD